MGAILADGSGIGVKSALAPLTGAGGSTPSADATGEADAAGAGETAEMFDLDGPDGAVGPLTGLFEADQKARRGPGRPPGSPNKRTEDLRRFILARFKHPVVALMEIGSVPTRELMGELGLKPDQALALQIRALDAAAPYVDSKMPMKLSISDSDRLPSFHLHFGADGSAKATDAGGKVLDLTALHERAKAAMLQRLSDERPEGSHDVGSHDGAKAQKDQGFDAL